MDKETFKRLFVTLVRPHLEYAQSVWSPYLIKHINMIENVQMRATKLVDNIGSLDYGERLKALELPSLSYRRKRGDMIEVYKHFNSYDEQSLSPSFQPRDRTTRGNTLKLTERIPSDGCRGLQTNSFYHRTTRTWNELPDHVVRAKTIDTFKNRLDQHWEEMKYKWE